MAHLICIWKSTTSVIGGHFGKKSKGQRWGCIDVFIEELCYRKRRKFYTEWLNSVSQFDVLLFNSLLVPLCLTPFCLMPFCLMPLCLRPFIWCPFVWCPFVWFPFVFSLYGTRYSWKYHSLAMSIKSGLYWWIFNGESIPSWICWNLSIIACPGSGFSTIISIWMGWSCQWATWSILWKTLSNWKSVMTSPDFWLLCCQQLLN